jgi:type II secretory pathway component PulJ
VEQTRAGFPAALGWTRCSGEPAAFSLIELMASILAISLVLGAVFTLLYNSQIGFQTSTVVSESNQSARGAFEIMTQEIGQAGFNPQFTSGKTSSSAITPNAKVQCITLDNITGINPGDWVGVDTGGYYELVQVVATTNAALSGQTTCGGANQISGLFEQCHNSSDTSCGNSTGVPYPVTSYKFSYPGGILLSQTVSFNGSNISVSNDHVLAMFYGDTDNSGTVWYVVYSLYNPTTASPQSVTINSTTYYLYTLYRSITQVTFATGATATQAYPLVNNVLYSGITGSGNTGPTGQALFSYPDPVQVTVIPGTISVVGTVVINLNVMVNPKSLQNAGTVQWYTMASQLRPLNLWSAVTTNQTGGGQYLPPTPLGLPMAFPSVNSYYF